MPRPKKDEMVLLVDTPDTPFRLIGKYGKVIFCKEGHVGLLVLEPDGRTTLEGSARLDGILRLPIEAIRRLSPLEQLALTAEDTEQ